MTTEPTTELERLWALEWSYSPGRTCCPVCKGIRPEGHADSCWLARRIRDLEAAERATREWLPDGAQPIFDWATEEASRWRLGRL